MKNGELEFAKNFISRRDKFVKEFSWNNIAGNT